MIYDQIRDVTSFQMRPSSFSVTSSQEFRLSLLPQWLYTADVYFITVAFQFSLTNCSNKNTVDIDETEKIVKMASEMFRRGTNWQTSQGLLRPSSSAALKRLSNLYHTTRRNIPKDANLHNLRREYLKYHDTKAFVSYEINILYTAHQTLRLV
jgi:hypothetical protein